MKIIKHTPVQLSILALMLAAPPYLASPLFDQTDITSPPRGEALVAITAR